MAPWQIMGETLLGQFRGGLIVLRERFTRDTRPRHVNKEQAAEGVQKFETRQKKTV